jgi:hypothetical protein
LVFELPETEVSGNSLLGFGFRTFHEALEESDCVGADSTCTGSYGTTVAMTCSAGTYWQWLFGFHDRGGGNGGGFGVGHDVSPMCQY